MNLGYIGLGKMGHNMVAHLLKKKYEIIAYDQSEEAMKKATTLGAQTATSTKNLTDILDSPRTIWIMVPHKVVDAVLEELSAYLKDGDTVIDGGNSFFKDSIRRGNELDQKGVAYIDVGISGGPGSFATGVAVMVGGKQDVVLRHEKLFKEIALGKGYAHMGKPGAGHFVKMVHNGIEYGMMQAIAEGFNLMKQSPFNVDLEKVADVYNNGSIVESRLVEWLSSGFETYGEDLKEVSGSAKSTGEGAWTVQTAKELNIPTPIIEGALAFRKESEKNPSYIGKILSTLRNQFGGHDIR